MNISEVSAMYNSTTETSRTSSNELDQDAFLSILVTQLQNQDPTSPMDNTEFVSQLAQFSALEQMQQINSGTKLAQASNMVGRYIYAITSDEDSVVSEVFGKVDGMYIEDDEAYLLVGENKIALEDVVASYDSDTVENVDVIQSLLNSTGLIGKYAKGTITVDDETIPVEGIVDSIEVEDGNVYAIIGENKVNIINIESVVAA